MKKYKIWIRGDHIEELSLDEIKSRIESGRLTGKEDAVLAIVDPKYKKNIRDYLEIDNLFLNYGSESESTQLKTGLLRRQVSDKTKIDIVPPQVQNSPAPLSNEWGDDDVKNAKTSLLELPKNLHKEEKRKFGIPKRSFLVLILIAFVFYDFLFDEENDVPKTKPSYEFKLVRPSLPALTTAQPDPKLALEYYQKAVQQYLMDNVQSYKNAALLFRKSLSYDSQNIRSLAMLASTYINLLESTNKDENTFNVINKLIELSTSQSTTLTETLMAEAEFLTSLNRYDAAQEKISSFYKLTGKMDPLLFYELAYISYLKDDYTQANKYLNLIPASALKIAKVYYLRGLLREKNAQYADAKVEYQLALKLNPMHAKSINRMIHISEVEGNLKNEQKRIDFLYQNPQLQQPSEYVDLLQLKSKLALILKNSDIAISSIQEALKLKPKDENLKLTYYTLISEQQNSEKYKNIAQMYALLLEADAQAKAKNEQEAILLLIKAKDTYPKSSQPAERMGDLFLSMGKLDKAQNEYEKAISINPKQPELAIKLIDVLIKNNDLNEAQKLLMKYRSEPSLKSSVDRLAGNIAYNQGNYIQAASFYKKAMSRDSVDPDVYISYANMLSRVGQCKDAQFFYLIAQKLDPTGQEAIFGNAQCLLKLSGIQEAVASIQNRLIKMQKPSPELLTLIAKLYYLNGDYDKALSFIQQSKAISYDYPEQYKVEGEIYLKLQHLDKMALAKSLAAWKAYSDRNPADPEGYMQRFNLYLKQPNFELAQNELDKVFEVSPRYPDLHLKRGQMFSMMGRYQDALSELESEVKNNPKSVPALIEYGNLLIKFKRYDDAMNQFVAAMKYDSKNPLAKASVAYVNFLQGKYTSAVALYTSAIQLDRGNPQLYKSLGQVYQKMGDEQKASEAFRSYLDLAPDAPDRKLYEGYK